MITALSEYGNLNLSRTMDQCYDQLCALLLSYLGVVFCHLNLIAECIFLACGFPVFEYSESTYSTPSWLPKGKHKQLDHHIATKACIYVL